MGFLKKMGGWLSERLDTDYSKDKDHLKNMSMGFLDDISGGYFSERRENREYFSARRQSMKREIEIQSQKEEVYLQKMINDTNLDFADKVATLKHKIALNNLQVQQTELHLKRQIDELERAKMQSRLDFDQQRQNQQLERDGFYNEEDRKDKLLDHEIRKDVSELHLKREAQQNDHELALATLELHRDRYEIERMQLQNEKLERALAGLVTSYTLANEMKHEERLKELEVMLKAFQTKLAYIQLLSKEQQEQEYKNLRDKLQEQMNSFFTGSGNANMYGEY